MYIYTRVFNCGLWLLYAPLVNVGAGQAVLSLEMQLITFVRPNLKLKTLHLWAIKHKQ